MPGKDLQISLPGQIRKLVQESAREDLDASIRLAINSLQRQIVTLQGQISDLAVSQQTQTVGELYSTINTTTQEMTNKSGVAVENGEVVIMDTANDESFKSTTTANDPEVIGVVFQDSPDGAAAAILNNESGLIITQGLCNVVVNADVRAVTRGDRLISHTNSGEAVSTAVETDVGVLGIALENKASGTGLITAMVHQPIKEKWFLEETITADSVAQATVSESIYEDATWGPLVLVNDTTNSPTNKLSFPNLITQTFFKSHGRGVLTTAGAVIINSKNDFGTGADKLLILYLPARLASQDRIDAVIAFISRSMLISSLDGTWLDGDGYDINTYNKFTLNAIDELNDMFRGMRQTISNEVNVAYDLDGAVTGLSGAVQSYATHTDAALTILIKHGVIGYDGNGFIVSHVISILNEDGGSRKIARAIEYQDERLDKIIQTVTRT